jgi:hypothetical protein
MIMEPPKIKFPQIVLAYIEQVIRNVKYRYKIRQEVKTELLAHFEDALRGVKDDADRQKKAEDLIRDFGDAKVLAVLIRRGKKRCRPLWQKAIIRSFHAAGLLFLLLILYIGWFFTGKPVITTNYVDKLNQWVRPVADENQNARPFYEEAVAEYKKPDVPDVNDFKLSPQKLTGLEDSQRVVVEKWISDNQKAMDLICQGNQKPYYWSVYSVEKSQQDGMPKMVEVIIPDLKNYKELARLLCWRAYQEAQKGKSEKAFNDLMTAYDFGRHIRMASGSVLVEQLAGFGIESMACQCLRDVLSDDSVDTAVLASIQQKFTTILEHEDFTLDLRSERLLLYDEIQRCYTYSRFGKEHLYLQRLSILGNNIEWERVFTLKGVKAGLWVLFAHPNRVDSIKSANRVYDLYDKLMVMTPAASRNKVAELEQQAEKIYKENIIIGLLVPTLRHVYDYSWEVKVHSDATNIILGLLRYKQEKKGYPAGLELLVEAGFLKEIPMDPYSNKSLVYRKTDDGFTLYSVGLNFVDDGGVRGKDRKGKPTDWGQDGDFVFWPVQKEEPVKIQSSGKN